MFTIEIVKGPSWRELTEMIDRRTYVTDNVDAALAEANHWLAHMLATQPQRGATYYRVVTPSGTTIGGA